MRLVASHFGMLVALALLGLAGTAGAASAAKVVKFGLGFSTGTIVVINDERKLYYVIGKGRALQYPIAVGRKSQVWTGKSYVSQKVKDPSWLNPDDPEAEVVPPGPENPLGVRALYLGSTLYRIHGTPAAGSIGQAVSNGCVRMFNADVKDLFNRVKVGTPVVAINSRATTKAPKQPTVVNLKLYNQEKARKAKQLATRVVKKKKRQQTVGIYAVTF
jgi:lipoprotein-anchoring transpeptidase ErfK/SrfK